MEFLNKWAPGRPARELFHRVDFDLRFKPLALMRNGVVTSAQTLRDEVFFFEKTWGFFFNFVL